VKKKFGLLLLFFLSFVLIFNGCLKIELKNMDNQKDENDNSIIWIKALVYIEKNDNKIDYILIDKPESKSRVSYHLIDLKTQQKNILEKLNGKMVEAQIKVIEELSPWNKKALLLKLKY